MNKNEGPTEVALRPRVLMLTFRVEALCSVGHGHLVLTGVSLPTPTEILPLETSHRVGKNGCNCDF